MLFVLCVQQTKECRCTAAHMELCVAHPPIPIVINLRKQLLEGLQGAYPAAMAPFVMMPAKGGLCELRSCEHSCYGGSRAAGCRQVLTAAADAERAL